MLLLIYQAVTALMPMACCCRSGFVWFTRNGSDDYTFSKRA